MKTTNRNSTTAAEPRGSQGRDAPDATNGARR